MDPGRTWRSVPDRAALAVGARVQLSFVKYAPYTQRADLAVSDRLGVVEARFEGGWIVVDDLGERHRLHDAGLDADEPDDARGRWRIDGAIPTYCIGERLELAWRYRNQAAGDPPRANRTAIVIDEHADMVTMQLDDGSTFELYRFGAQADERDRSAPRWFVVGRLPVERA